jgi:hypothetical protein
LAKVNDLKKLQSNFYLFVLGALRGRKPPENGEAEKPQALKRGGRLSPFYLFCGVDGA